MQVVEPNPALTPTTTQVVEPLPGGAALKLTVAKYYTPSGRLGVGVGVGVGAGVGVGVWVG